MENYGRILVLAQGVEPLNLGINRLQTARLRASQGVAVRLSRIRVMTQSSQRVSGFLTESPAKAVNEAVRKAAATQLVARTATVTKTMIPNTPHAGITRARYKAQ